MTDRNGTRRINRGRGHSYLLDGSPVQGVTTILSKGIPKPALVDWAARTTAGYAIDHWDELGQVGLAERLRTLERARWDTTRAAALRGTTIHEFAQRLTAGEEVDVPDEISGHVDAYLSFVADWQPRELLVEAPIFNRKIQFAGTLDLIAELADGQTWLLDWKTGGKGIFPETALQLAAYRNAEFYLDADGNEQPMPPVDQCGAVWLRADGYDLYPLHSGTDVFLLFRYARELAVRFADAEREDFIDNAATAPVA